MGSSSLPRLFLEEGLAEMEEGRADRWTRNGGRRKGLRARQKRSRREEKKRERTPHCVWPGGEPELQWTAGETDLARAA